MPLPAFAPGALTPASSHHRTSLTATPKPSPLICCGSQTARPPPPMDRRLTPACCMQPRPNTRVIPLSGLPTCLLDEASQHAMPCNARPSNRAFDSFFQRLRAQPSALTHLVHKPDACCVPSRHCLEGLVHLHMRREQVEQHLPRCPELHDLARAPQARDEAHEREALQAGTRK